MVATAFTHGGNLKKVEPVFYVGSTFFRQIFDVLFMIR